MAKLICWSYSFWLLILGSATFVFAVGPWVDMKFPVVNPFVVEEVVVTDSTMQFSGWMHKQRNCKLLDIYVQVSHSNARPTIHALEFPVSRILSRPMGEQGWGPWILRGVEKPEEVRLITKHLCHPLWETEGTYVLYRK